MDDHSGHAIYEIRCPKKNKVVSATLSCYLLAALSIVHIGTKGVLLVVRIWNVDKSGIKLRFSELFTGLDMVGRLSGLGHGMVRGAMYFTLKGNKIAFCTV